jgi:NAD(P)-dependent dehydrogenase (short-subunit alcohol dehydrogenase family)
VNLDQFSLAGRRALVVGADTGIGLACAHAIANAGADLVIAGLNQSEGDALAAKIAAKSKTKVSYVQVDVRQETQVKAMVDKAADILGGFDIAMNNAGVPGTPAKTSEYSVADFDNMFAVNVRGCFLGMRYEIPYLLKNKKGSIINLASTAGINGLAYCAPYAGTKHAVAGITKSVALELAPHNIRANCIAPGPVQTDFLVSMRRDRDAAAGVVPGGMSAKVPMERVAQPEEMTGAVVWLASDASSYVTGALISLDGGVVAA